MRLPTSSLPGLTPQVGLARLAALNNAELGQARVPVQSILLRKKMDARVTSAFTRVFDALLPAHDGSAIVFRRREFISLLGAAAAGWPLAARAQHAVPVVGFLNSASPDAFAPYVGGFLQGLRDAGYIDGQNVNVEYRWAYGQYDRLPQLAAELLAQQVAVIVASGGEPSVMAAKAATSRTPIVFHRRRPGQARAGCESQPPRRQYHRRVAVDLIVGGEAGRTTR